MIGPSPFNQANAARAEGLSSQERGRTGKADLPELSIQFKSVTAHDIPSKQDAASIRDGPRELEDMPEEDCKTFNICEDALSFVVNDDEAGSGGQKALLQIVGELKFQNEKDYVQQKIDQNSKLGKNLEALSKEIEARDARINADPHSLISINDRFAMENPKAYHSHVEMVKTGEIYTHMTARENELAAAKQKLRPKVEKNRRSTPDTRCRQLYRSLESSAAELNPTKGGQGGAYMGKNIVVKPKGEGIAELHNRKGNSYATTDNRCRDAIPLYQENEREAASYDIAVHLGLQHITPPTILAIVKNESFAHFTDRLGLDIDVSEMKKKLPPIDKEKVCTVQAMVPNRGDLQEMLKEWEKKAREWKESNSPGAKFTVEDFDHYVNSKVDFNDFEDCNILQWFTGENDGHGGNFLTVEKPNGRFGLIKIDNGLTYPEKNQDFDNGLVRYFDRLGKQPISQKAKQKILSASPQQMEAILKEYHLEGPINAMHERVQVMKKIIDEYPEITHFEMNKRLGKLYLGKEHALGDFTPGELAEFQEKGLQPARRKGRGSIVQKLKADLALAARPPVQNQQVEPRGGPTIAQRKDSLFKGGSTDQSPKKGGRLAEEVETARKQANFKGLRDLFNK